MEKCLDTLIRMVEHTGPYKAHWSAGELYFVVGHHCAYKCTETDVLAAGDRNTFHYAYKCERLEEGVLALLAGISFCEASETEFDISFSLKACEIVELSGYSEVYAAICGRTVKLPFLLRGLDVDQDKNCRLFRRAYPHCASLAKLYLPDLSKERVIAMAVYLVKYWSFGWEKWK